MKSVCILGGGSYGTALAQLLAGLGHSVHVWNRSPEIAAAINETRRNPRYLSEFVLHPNILAHTDAHEAIRSAEWTVIAVPSVAFRETLKSQAKLLRSQPLVIGTKGLENGSLMTMAEVAVDVLGEEHATEVLALSGPSFAREIMLQHPTAVVLAGVDESLTRQISRLMFCDFFRAYTSTDIIGVELGGALKNVMAIAAGAVLGLGFGDNTRAALITRGVAEISRLAVAKGAHPLTMSGLAGVGDIILTCTGGLSRNRAVGQALGEGKTLDEAIRGVKQVAEGVATAAAAEELAQRLGVEAPIIHAVNSVLHGNLPIREAMLTLVRREPGRELGDDA